MVDSSSGKKWLSNLIPFLGYAITGINNEVAVYIQKWTINSHMHHKFGDYRRRFFSWKHNDIKKKLQHKKKRYGIYTATHEKKFTDERDQLDNEFTKYFFEQYTEFEKTLIRQFNQKGKQFVEGMSRVWYPQETSTGRERDPKVEESLQKVLDLMMENVITTVKDLQELQSATKKLFSKMHETIPQERLYTCEATMGQWFSYATLEKNCLVYLGKKSWSKTCKYLYHFHLYNIISQIKSSLESQNRTAELSELDDVLRRTAGLYHESAVVHDIQLKMDVCSDDLRNKIDEICKGENVTKNSGMYYGLLND